MSTYDVRLLIGDTDSTDYALQDHDVSFFLNEANDNIYLAASMAAEAIAAKYARQVTESKTDAHGVHVYSRHLSDRYKHYTALAKTMRERHTARTVGVYAGGITISGKDTREADTDRVKPAFTRDLHANEGSS